MAIVVDVINNNSLNYFIFYNGISRQTILLKHGSNLHCREYCRVVIVTCWAKVKTAIKIIKFDTKILFALNSTFVPIKSVYISPPTQLWE